MDEQLARRIGERVRFYRTAARQTKTVTAGLAGITPDYLYQLERGSKLPTITVLLQLARALDMPVAKLIGDHSQPVEARPTATVGQAIYRALTSPTPARRPPQLPDLRSRIASAWMTWQTSPHRYSKIAAQLPALIIDTELAVRSASADERRTAHRYFADLHGLVRTVTKRIGRVDLSLLAADRAIRAAQVADDPFRLAAAHWNLAQVLLADEQPEGAENVALHGIEQLRGEADRSDVDALALHGALLLIAAVAAARQGNAWTAHDRLRQAEPLANHTGERNTSWTAFGPTNVDMYRVALAVETGQAAEALRLAERVERDDSPSIERRVAFLLDQAKGYQQRRDFASALVILQTVAREAPEDMAHRPSAHASLKVIMYSGRRSTATEAARLAAQVAVPVR